MAKKKGIYILILVIVLMVVLTLILALMSKKWSKETVANIIESPIPEPTEFSISNPESAQETEHEENNEIMSKNSQEQTIAPEPEYFYSDFVFPKQGERPYAVMIDNEGTRSLPQGGIYKAQFVYEIIVEGGETRLMPVFFSTTPEMIGPVRSSRHYFLDYVMEHDAIYVHFGWSPMAMRDIPKFGINNLNGVANGGEVFWDLTKDPGNWQDSYTSIKKVKDYVDKVKYRTETDKGLMFSYNEVDEELNAGERAEKINIKYSHSYTCAFEYDIDKKAYFRYRKGKPHLERITDQQLTAKNIIIQPVTNFTIKGDKEGRQEVITVGEGSGWYITDGKAVEIRWSKKTRSGQTEYTDVKGNEIKLNPGPTWIQIVPDEGGVSIQ